MSPSQLLKHVKALPAEERQRLLREILLLEEEAGEPQPPEEVQTPVKWPDVEVRARRIVGDRVLPNLVLIERGEENS